MEASVPSQDAILLYETPDSDVYFYEGEGISQIIANFPEDISTLLYKFQLAVVTVHFLPGVYAGGCIAIVNAAGYYRK